tara:strand:- start:18013 stop:18360 length:348 start_codon:yes stop_codon:yes gene_type:complete
LNEAFNRNNLETWSLLRSYAVKNVCLSWVFGGLLFFFAYSLADSEAVASESKACAKKCYKSMYQCLIKGSPLSKEACFSENVGQMLMCIDSKGMGSLKRKRECFGERKKCIAACE